MDKKQYEIHDIDDLFLLIKQENFQQLPQDPDNLAFIYKNSKDKIIFIPPVGSRGIFFENEMAYRNALSAPESFPLKEENPNPFQSEQSRIASLESNILYYFEVLNQELSIRIDALNDDLTYLDSIDQRIKNYGYQKTYEKLFIPLGVFFGEKIKAKKNATWRLNKKFGYMPYFEPTLIDDNREYFPWYKLFDMLIERKTFNTSNYYQQISRGVPIEKR